MEKLLDSVTGQEDRSRMLHSITLQVLDAELLVLMLMPALWILQTFIKAAPSNEEFSILVGGCKFVRKTY